MQPDQIFNILPKDALSDMEFINSDGFKIPPCPSVVKELMILRENGDFDLDDLVRVIELDPVLTAFLFKLATGVLFHQNKIKLETISDCIFYVLGVENSLFLALEIGMMNQLGVQEEIINESCWLHSLAVAEIAKLIAQDCKMDHRVAYLSGLLHDIGHIVLNALCANYLLINDMTFSNSDKETLSLSALETDIYGTTHTEVGYHLAKEWNLPEPAAIVIRDHHTTPIPMTAWADYVAVIKLSEEILFAMDSDFGLESVKNQKSENLEVLGYKNWEDMFHLDSKIQTIVSMYRKTL